MSDSLSKMPHIIWLVRHAESAGNVARDAAHAAQKTHIELSMRDVDVPLSTRGIEQAEALGKWYGAQDDDARPEVILTSPYRRAAQTAQILRTSCARRRNKALPIVVDERLREKEFGVLDGLTRQGIEQYQPEQAEIRRSLGKFYHRPPGGESWCDVILRLRSALHTLSLHYSEQRVLVVSHQVVVLCFRYLLENLDEAQLLAIDSQGDVANCSVTQFTRPPDGTAALRLVRYNWTVPLEREGALVTASADANEGTR